jgi:hypothetical protein
MKCVINNIQRIWGCFISVCVVSCLVIYLGDVQVAEAAAAKRPLKKVFLQSDFSSGTIPSEWFCNDATGDCKVESFSWNGGSTFVPSLLLSASEGQNWIGLGYPRSQLQQFNPNRFNIGRKYHCLGSLYIVPPPDPDHWIKGYAVLIGPQMHPSNNNSPFMSILLSPGGIGNTETHVYVVGASEDNSGLDVMVDIGPVAQWLNQEIKYDYYFTPSHTRGLQQININGVPKYTKSTGPSIFKQDKDGGYVAFSVYDWNNQISGTVSIYLSSMICYDET